MFLSEINYDLGIDYKLIKDGEYENLGLIAETELNNIFSFLRDEKYISSVLNNKRITCLAMTEEIYRLGNFEGYGVVVTSKPDKFLYTLQNYFCNNGILYRNKSIASQIGNGTIIADGAYVAPTGVVIGDNTYIESGAVILSGAKIGNNCFIGANTTIGSRGFQFYRDEFESFYVEHGAGTVLGDRVEILSGCCIANGLFRPTVVENDVKMDNLVHIGHSAIIRERTLIPAGVTVSGSVIVGKDVWIGVHSVINSFVNVGDEAFICMGSVVNRNVEAKACVSGNFALDHEVHMASIKAMSNK